MNAERGKELVSISTTTHHFDRKVSVAHHQDIHIFEVGILTDISSS